MLIRFAWAIFTKADAIADPCCPAYTCTCRLKCCACRLGAWSRNKQRPLRGSGLGALAPSRLGNSVHTVFFPEDLWFSLQTDPFKTTRLPQKYDVGNNRLMHFLPTHIPKLSRWSIPPAYECLQVRQAFHSQEWSISNFPCSLTRNVTSHSLKNFAFHS